VEEKEHERKTDERDGQTCKEIRRPVDAEVKTRNADGGNDEEKKHCRNSALHRTGLTLQHK
jgi:hypothetical protein